MKPLLAAPVEPLDPEEAPVTAACLQKAGLRRELFERAQAVMTEVQLAELLAAWPKSAKEAP